MQWIERRHRLLEDDRDVVAAHMAHVAFAQWKKVTTLEHDRARRMVCRRIGKQLHHRKGGDRFARSGFPDKRDRLTLADVERHTIDGQKLALTSSEGDRKVADRQQSFVRVHLKVFLGSNASRTASPMKISNESMIAMLKKPVRPSHGACTLAFPCDSNSPSDGEPGGRPKPRKSSAVNVITDDDKMNGRNVMLSTIAIGSKCRKIMTVLETPRARAAWMYSKFRPRKNSAHTNPTRDTQENSSNIPSRTKKPGTRTDEMISSR